jgi:hypothetical protein
VDGRYTKWLAALGLAALGGFAYMGTRAWGAFTGLVRLNASKPAVGLQIVYQASQPAGWEQYLGQFDFLNIKIINGTTNYRPAEVAYHMDLARAHGIPVQGWGYHYLTSPTAATNEGTAAANRCLALGIDVYWVNAEKQWAGQRGETPQPNAVAHMLGFVAAFRSVAPAVKLAYQSYASNAPPHIKSRIVEIARAFDSWGPMIYGTLIGTIERKWHEQAGVASQAGIPYTPTPATGRYEPGTGFWGFSHSDGSHSGLYDLQSESPAEWINFYVGGPGGGAMIAQGNDLNDSLVVASQTLKATVGVS